MHINNTGRRHDVEDTGLMYYRRRFYSPELGRFISRDPLKYVDGMSMYRAYFVVDGLDPSGMSTDQSYDWTDAEEIGKQILGMGAEAVLGIMFPKMGAAWAVAKAALAIEAIYYFGKCMENRGKTLQTIQDNMEKLGCTQFCKGIKKKSCEVLQEMANEQKGIGDCGNNLAIALGLSLDVVTAGYFSMVGYAK